MYSEMMGHSHSRSPCLNQRGLAEISGSPMGQGTESREPRRQERACFCFARGAGLDRFSIGVSGGVTVAQGPLEAFVMVRIHAGQPTFLGKMKGLAPAAQLLHRIPLI